MNMQPIVGTSTNTSTMTSLVVGSSGSPLESSIFRVHKKLREVNEKAYEPDIVSIGPYHRGKSSLQMMEVQKLLYLQLFLMQRNERDAERYINALKPLEEKARKCYAEYINLNSNEFVEMMLLDGFFIIEVILRFGGETTMDKDDPRTDPKNDPIFKMQWMVDSLQRDLMLFENQLPLFVLVKILDMVCVPLIPPHNPLPPHNPFFDKALRFFDDLLPSDHDNLFLRETFYDSAENYVLGNSHLLEFVHKSWFRVLFVHDMCSGLVQERKKRGSIPSTTELQEAGVKLKKAANRFLLNIKFEGGVIRVPSLTIEDRTETFFRNLVAFEQYRPTNEPSPLTDYVRFLDCLIDTPKDVQILSSLGIIDNWLGDDEVVSTMFNTISEAVAAPRNTFRYVDIFARVNEHCSRRRIRWMAILKRDYFNSPWSLISVLAALLLLVLTFTQTTFTIFPHN